MATNRLTCAEQGSEVGLVSIINGGGDCDDYEIAIGKCGWIGCDREVSRSFQFCCAHFTCRVDKMFIRANLLAGEVKTHSRKPLPEFYGEGQTDISKANNCDLIHCDSDLA